MEHIYDNIKTADKLLMQVEKPGRYIGGELHTVKKTFSNQYKIWICISGYLRNRQSYLGLQIIYHILNSMESVYCERIFAPAEDMENLMKESLAVIYFGDEITSERSGYFRIHSSI